MICRSLVTCVLAVSSSLNLASSLQLTQDIQANSNVLTIVSYNVDGRPCYIGHDGQYERIDRVADMIDSQLGPVDVVIFQEVFLDGLYDILKTKLVSKGFKYISSVLDHQPRTLLAFLNGGVMIASRLPFSEVKTMSYSACSMPDCFSNKGAMYVKIHRDDRDLHIFGTHLQAWRIEDAVITRQKQATELKNFKDSLNIPAEDIVVFAGDLNIDLLSFPVEVQDLVGILNTTFPQISGGQKATSEPTTNRLVGSDTAASQNGCATQYDYSANMCECCTDEWLDYVLISKEHYQPSHVKFEAVKVKAPEAFEVCTHSYFFSCVCPEPDKFPGCYNSNYTCLATRFIDDISDHYPVVATLYL